MNQRSALLIAAFLVTGLFSSCKFYFNESEYLGTYPGTLESDVAMYQSCAGQAILTDVGDNKINVTLVTDSNPTFYFNNLTVERGFFLQSEQLLVYSDDVDLRINRITHSLYLSYYTGGSYYDFHFYGNRQ